jgi:hypothetical protein
MRQRPEYLTSTGSLLFVVLFWANGMGDIRALHAGWVIGRIY